MVMAYLNVDCSIQSQNYINGTPQYAVIAEKSCKSFGILNVQAPDTCWLYGPSVPGSISMSYHLSRYIYSSGQLRRDACT